MEYFISHIGVIFIAALFVAAAAVLWWYLTDKNARLIRQRAEAKRREASEAVKKTDCNGDEDHK